MNGTELFFREERHRRDEIALWLPPGRSVTFGELKALGASAQAVMRGHDIGPGDSVLLFEPLGPRLYGAVLGLMALGVGVALVEPWMPVEKIDHVVRVLRPKAFLAHPVGQLWGARVRAIREIPHWIRTTLIHEAATGVTVEDVDGDSAGIITFTSGTTGSPKGMVRTHRYLVDQHRILTESLGSDAFQGPDLCIFANFVLANLASGRGSVIVPPRWRTRDLRAIDALPRDLRPETLTCGPAFLLRILDEASLPGLKSIHVGGALTDCAILERGFAKWPAAHWTHLYGSTEVEPVAAADARLAVERSREKGFFQTLFLGSPIPDIAAEQTPDTVWVTGPHVCPKYLANEEENRKYKRRDELGRVWHRMGDRITVEDGAWWYAGREAQPASDFLLEQKLYTVLGSSAAFVEREPAGTLVVYCQAAERREKLIRDAFPEVGRVVDTTIRRDRRHKARIDRAASKPRVDRVASSRRPSWRTATAG